MYSTWTRFNPFILYCYGNGLEDMVKFLQENYPQSPIRGYVNHKQTESILQLNPSNLTETEDWVWLRLENLEDFKNCEGKGRSRLIENKIILGTSFKI